MLKNIFVFFLFALITTFSIQPVFAGGQLFHFQADTNGWKSDSGYGRIVRVFITQGNFPCKGTTLTFKFVEPKDGDYIATGDGSNGTYVIQEDGTNGCSTYAKMISKNSETRQVTVTGKNGDRVWEAPNAPVILVDFDGQYHGDNSYNGYSYRSSTDNPYGSSTVSQAATPTPYPVPTGDLKVFVLSQQVTPYGRNVLLKWSVVEGGPIFYDIYGKSATDTDWQRLLSDQGGPSATVTIKASEDYYLKVKGCIRKVGNCIDSNVLLLPKIQKEDGTVITGKPIQTISSIPSGDNQKVEELNKKVASLEGKLKQSEKKQNILEQRINELIAWIKEHIPFIQ